MLYSFGPELTAAIALASMILHATLFYLVARLVGCPSSYTYTAKYWYDDPYTGESGEKAHSEGRSTAFYWVIAGLWEGLMVACALVTRSDITFQNNSLNYLALLLAIIGYVAYLIAVMIHRR